MLKRPFLLLLLLLITALVLFYLASRKQIFSNPPADKDLSRKKAASPLMPASPTSSGLSNMTQSNESVTLHLLSQLKEGLQSSNKDLIRKKANELRKKAIQDREILLKICQLLKDNEQDERLREILAIILGTIQSQDAEQALLMALAQTPQLNLKRWLIHALGCMKEPEDEDIFEGLDNPWVVEHPSGLQIMVKKDIVNSQIKQALLTMLADSNLESLHWVIVRTLRHSMEDASLRTEFFYALNRGYDNATIAEIGQALASWALQAPESFMAEKRLIVNALLDQCNMAKHQSLRLLTEGYLKELPLSKSDAEKVMSFLINSSDFDVRYWAINLLGKKAGDFDDTTRITLAYIYIDILSSDSNSKLRDKAAEFLGKFHHNSAAVEALIQSLLYDPDWNVRDSAAEALGIIETDLDVSAALRKVAEEDANETVRKTAYTSLEKIRNRRK